MDYHYVITMDACVLKESKGTSGINSGGSYNDNINAYGCRIPQSHAIKCVIRVSLKVGVSGVICHLNSSTATTDVMMIGGSRVFCHLDSLDLMSDIYIQY